MGSSLGRVRSRVGVVPTTTPPRRTVAPGGVLSRAISTLVGGRGGSGGAGLGAAVLTGGGGGAGAGRRRRLKAPMASARPAPMARAAPTRRRPTVTVVPADGRSVDTATPRASV